MEMKLSSVFSRHKQGHVCLDIYLQSYLSREMGAGANFAPFLRKHTSQQRHVHTHTLPLLTLFMSHREYIYVGLSFRQNLI